MTFRKKAGLGLLLVATLSFLVLAGWNYHLRRKLQNQKANLLAQGEFLSTSQRWPKPLKGDPEKTAAFSAALGRLKGGAVLTGNHVPMMRSVRFGRALAGSMLPDIQDNFSRQTNTWAELTQELEDNREELNVLRKCLNAPGLDFNLDYSQGFTLLLPHLAKTKQASQTFWMATALALHNRDLASAHTNLLTLLAFSQALQQDRLLISELVQISMAHMGANATWEALQTPGWTDGQLKELEEKWLSLKFVEPMEGSLTMERAMSSASMEELRGSAQKFSSSFNSLNGSFLPGAPAGGGSTSNLMDFLEAAPGKMKAKATHALWHYFWSYQDEVRALEISQAHIETLRQTNLTWKSASAEVDKRLHALRIKTSADDSEEHEFFDPKILQAKTFFSDMLLNNKNGIKRALTAETLKEIVSAAIALKRFQMRHGRYPSALTELAPDFLPKVPVDHMDGQPLRYRVESDGTFTLYSVGPDGIDQGGIPPADKTDTPRGWTLQPDWVWPTLASPEEIQAFETKRAEKNRPRPPRNRVKTPSSTNTTN